MNNKKNFITALVLQVVSIMQGLVLPRIIITTFGSEVNGLVSSITQFLSFISLLEGGLGAVVLAELYTPLEKQNKDKIRLILLSCQGFFNKLTVIFVVYTCVLAVLYPVFLAKNFEFKYVSTLILILSLTIVAQYMFSITNKLFLQACQKIYIVNIVMTVTVVLNLFISIMIIFIFPEIHAVKLGAAVIFFLQPFIFNYYIPKDYKIHLLFNQKINYKLEKRWSGFAQNIAYFINTNTDIVIVTCLLGFKSVSVYSVYMFAVNALRSIIISTTNSYQSALGKYYAMNDLDNLRNKFQQFECISSIISIILFSTCLLLINSFVGIYTTGVNDADYYQPQFALVIIFANLIYCVGEPYRLLVLAIGKFKETNIASIGEAILNIVVSVLLCFQFGLVGIAIGTLIAVMYRVLYFVLYVQKDILRLKYKIYVKLFIVLIVMILVNGCIYSLHPLMVNSFLGFITYGIVIVLLEAIVTVLIYKLFVLCGKIVK